MFNYAVITFLLRHQSASDDNVIKFDNWLYNRTSDKITKPFWTKLSTDMLLVALTLCVYILVSVMLYGATILFDFSIAARYIAFVSCVTACASVFIFLQVFNNTFRTIHTKLRHQDFLKDLQEQKVTVSEFLATRSAVVRAEYDLLKKSEPTTESIDDVQEKLKTLSQLRNIQRNINPEWNSQF